MTNTTNTVHTTPSGRVWTDVLALTNFDLACAVLEIDQAPLAIAQEAVEWAKDEDFRRAVAGIPSILG